MTESNIEMIKPGILVVGVINLIGGIHYNREYEDSYFEDKAQVREWKTISRVDDAEERRRAQKTCSRLYQLVRRRCVKTPIGLICRKDKEEELQQVLQQVKEERDQFNNLAQTCRITTYHDCFEVGANNHETITAIMEQIARVAESVDSAITADDRTMLQSSARKWLKGMNPNAVLLLSETERNAIVARVRAELIRKAIKEIKDVETLLPEEASKATKAMVKKSRRIAKILCRKVERRNEALDTTLDEVDLTGLRKTRAAFIAAAIKAEKKTSPRSEKVSPIETRNLVQHV